MDLNNANINISKSRELIPINNGLTNFRTEFNIKSQGGEPFRAVIINQSNLDNSENIEMKNAPKGIFSGRIIENSGNKDDWYIAIEADQDIEAFASITTVEVEPRMKEDFACNEKEPPQKKKRLSIWIIGLIIAAIVAIGYFIFKIFIKKKKPAPAEEVITPPLTEKEEGIEIKQEPVIPETPLVVEKDSPQPPPAAQEKKIVEAPPPQELNLDFSDLPDL